MRQAQDKQAAMNDKSSSNKSQELKEFKKPASIKRQLTIADQEQASLFEEAPVNEVPTFIG